MTKIVVGKVGRLVGTQGFYSIISYTHPPDSIVNYQPWWIDNQKILHQDKKIHHKKILVRLMSGNKPDGLINRLILIEKKLLPLLGKEECYHDDLLGLKVHNMQNICLGVLEWVMPNPAHDILMIRRPNQKTCLIPFIMDHFVQSVDLDNQLIWVDWDDDF